MTSETMTDQPNTTSIPEEETEGLFICGTISEEGDGYLADTSVDKLVNNKEENDDDDSASSSSKSGASPQLASPPSTDDSDDDEMMEKQIEEAVTCSPPEAEEGNDEINDADENSNSVNIESIRANALMLLERADQIKTVQATNGDTDKAQEEVTAIRENNNEQQDEEEEGMEDIPLISNSHLFEVDALQETGPESKNIDPLVEEQQKQETSSALINPPQREMSYFGVLCHCISFLFFQDVSSNNNIDDNDYEGGGSSYHSRPSRRRHHDLLITTDERRAALESLLLPLSVVLPDVAAGENLSVAAGDNPSVVRHDDDKQESKNENRAEVNQDGDYIPETNSFNHSLVGDEDDPRRIDSGEEDSCDHSHASSEVSVLTGPQPSSHEHDGMCQICSQEFGDPRDVAQFNCPNCTQRFHTDCVLNWLELRRDQKCPCCRRDIFTNDMIGKAVNKARVDLGRKQELWDIDDLTKDETEEELVALENEEIVFEPTDRDAVFSDISESVYTDTSKDTEIVAIRC